MNGHDDPKPVLVAADPKTAGSICRSLEKLDYRAIPAATVREVLQLTEQTYFDLAFMAADLDGEPCDEAVAHLCEIFPETLVMVMSEHPDVSSTVTALRLGAFNYLDLPPSPEQLENAVAEAREYRRLRQETSLRRRQIQLKYDVENIVGSSRPMAEVFRLIHKVAATDATVLVLGESGTGKELVARAIHHQSTRRDAPLVPVNCGAIPEELLESELFGHEKGAFTGAVRARMGRFELAQGGTIFLDEIGDMSPLLQVKLLRVLQEHQFERIGGVKTIDADIRVIAATNQDLEERVAQGRFREDLYYRLDVVPIKVPPLRQRRSDIPALCEHFLSRLEQQKGITRRSLTPGVMEALMRYDWTGNVRELENLLERMVILAEGESISLEDLPAKIAGDRREAPRPGDGQAVLHTVTVPDEGLDFNAAVDAFESGLILQALERTGWVKNQAAALLKLNRTTLVEKIKKKGLQPADTAGHT